MPELILGATVVDLDRCEVRRDSVSLPLTPTEAALLAVLAERRGRAVARDALYREVWGYAGRVVGRAVDKTVHRLRSKLGPDRDCLVTVRGVGFLLDVPQARLDPDLVGRDAEAGALDGWLSGDDRAVLLFGSAGTGKTRLATSWLRASGRPAATVRLGEVDGARALRAAVAQALDLVPGSLPAALDHLPVQLLLLDDARSLSGALGEALIEWLAATRRIRLVLTSRERVALPSTVAIDVAPLGADAACTLLQRRARAVGVAVRDDDARAIAEAVDRVPLGIELSAAQLRVMDVGALRDRLHGGGARGLRTVLGGLLAALEVSWAVLDARERTALAALTCFRGGFDAAAAEAVIGSADGLDVLADLAAHSLVTRRDDDRLDLLAHIAAYAREHHPDVADAELRHARYYTALTASHLDPLTDEYDRDGRLRLLAERDNLRAALRVALARGDDDLAVRVFLGLVPLLQHDSPHLEDLAEAVVARLEGVDPGLAARCLVCAANSDPGRPAHAAWARQAAAMAPHPAVRARALEVLVVHHHRRAEWVQARATLDRAMAVAEAVPVVAAQLHLPAGSLSRSQGDLEQAALHYRRAAELGYTTRRGRLAAAGFANLGIVELGLGHSEAAESCLRQSLELCAAHGLFGLALYPALSLASALLDRDEDAEAAVQAQAAAQGARRTGNDSILGGALGLLALVALRAGDDRRAEILLRDALGVLRRANDQAQARCALAIALHGQGRLEEAESAWSAGLPGLPAGMRDGLLLLRATLAHERDPTGVAAIADQIGDPVLADHARRPGRALPLLSPEVAAYAPMLARLAARVGWDQVGTRRPTTDP